ncbi:MAG: nitroreductase family protein [Candidatus Diapherotrites archaeon]
MDFFETVLQRHSVRKFQEKTVEKEKLQKILETANSAPSAGNLQAYKIVVVEKKELKEKLSFAAFGQKFLVQAPLLLVFCSLPEKSEQRYGARGSLYSIQDATIAASYAQLAATALGLASVWVGAFDEEEVSKALNLEENMAPISIIPIGYAAEKPFRAPRKSLKELVEKK